MSAAATAVSLDKSKSYRAILLGGLTAGVLDIAAAFINSARFGRSPMRVLQSIASGLLGADSYTGGLRSAALGAALHFLIAFVACAVYYAASRRLKILLQRAIVCGVLYGIAVYLFMYLVVLPLTFHRSFVRSLDEVVIGLIIHILCVGLPIGLIVSRYSTAARD